MSNVDDALPIAAGLDWGVVLTLTKNTGLDIPVFDASMKLRADVRDYPNAPNALAVLTNANGGIAINDANSITLRLDGSVTAKAADSHLYLDLVQLDGVVPVYLYVMLKVPVLQPLTRLMA